MLLSVCIPTFNRGMFLDECLTSLATTCAVSESVEICISDNGSTDDTAAVIEKWKDRLQIVYYRSDINRGIPINFLNVVSIASGKYIWLLGDDDVVVPGAIDIILALLRSNEGVDFFLFNSVNLSQRSELNSDFSLKKDKNKSLFWKSEISGCVAFREIIERNVTFDHLGGMYLSIFRRSSWNSSADKLDKKAMQSGDLFDSHVSTFPHVCIFALSFMKSHAFVCDVAICYSFSDAREWRPYYPLIRSVRLLESLECYKLNGLSVDSFNKLKNQSLAYFVEDFIKIAVFRKWYFGANYINFGSLLIENCKYRGFWISIISLILKVFKKIKKHMSGKTI